MTGNPPALDERVAEAEPKNALFARDLVAPPGAREGETILDGKQTLVQLEQLEGTVWHARISDGIVVPNPNQPREDFDEAEMEKLKETLRGKGQKQPINVVPIRSIETGEIKLMIIDGERRWRALTAIGNDHVKLIINWAETEREVFFLSLILNESKADHNPIERAKAYRKLKKYFEEEGQEDPIKAIADKLGKSKKDIEDHLELLEFLEQLPPADSAEIQKMVAGGALPTSSVLHLKSTAKKLGARLSIIRCTRALVDSLGRVREEEGTAGPLSRKGIRKAQRDALLATLTGGGAVAGSPDAQKFLAMTSLRAFLSGVAYAKTGLKAASTTDAPTLISFLRERRGNPPEAVLDKLLEVRRMLDQVIANIVQKAIDPDPVPEIPGKPKFAEHVTKKEASFGTPLRQKMIRMIAEASDAQKVVSIVEMARVFGIEANGVAGSIQFLEKELAALGLKLQQHTVREKDSKGMYEKKVAYRLVWAEEADAPVPMVKALSPASPPEPVPTPTPAPASAGPASTPKPTPASAAASPAPAATPAPSPKPATAPAPAAPHPPRPATRPTYASAAPSPSAAKPKPTSAPASARPASTPAPESRSAPPRPNPDAPTRSNPPHVPYKAPPSPVKLKRPTLNSHERFLDAAAMQRINVDFEAIAAGDRLPGQKERLEVQLIEFGKRVQGLVSQQARQAMMIAGVRKEEPGIVIRDCGNFQEGMLGLRILRYDDKGRIRLRIMSNLRGFAALGESGRLAQLQAAAATTLNLRTENIDIQIEEIDVEAK